MKTSQTGFKWLLAVLNLLFRQNCIFCSGDRRGGGEYLCCTCFNDIGLIHTPICFVCGVCRQSPYKFDRAGSLGLYETALRRLIHHFKYQKQLGVLSDIDCLLEKYFSEYGKDYSGLTVSPIPLHFNKMRERV